MARKLKGFEIWLIGGLLAFSVSMVVADYALVQFTDYDSLKPAYTEIVGTLFEAREAIGPGELALFKQASLTQCAAGQEIIEFPLGEDGETISFTCQEMENTAAEDIPTLFAVKLYDETYYKDYGCEFTDCLAGFEEETGAAPTFLLSATAHDFFKRNLSSLILLAGFLAALFVFVARDLGLILKRFGWIGVVVGMPGPILTFGRDAFYSQLAQGFPEEGVELVSTIVGGVLNSIAEAYMTVFVVGIILLVAGFLVAFLKK